MTTKEEAIKAAAEVYSNWLIVRAETDEEMREKLEELDPSTEPPAPK